VHRLRDPRRFRREYLPRLRVLGAIGRRDFLRAELGRIQARELVELEVDDLLTDWATPPGKTSKSFKFPYTGGVFRTRASESIEGIDAKVILADETKYVFGFRCPDSDHKKLMARVRDYFRKNATKKFQPHVLIDVLLGDLRVRYPQIFTALAKKLGKKATQAR
jgi:hypothetical protein